MNEDIFYMSERGKFANKAAIAFFSLASLAISAALLYKMLDEHLNKPLPSDSAYIADVNNDGLKDIVLKEDGKYRVFLQDKKGDYILSAKEYGNLQNLIKTK